MDTKNNTDVVKSNALIDAAYSPGSVYQMRVLMAVLLQIKSKEKLDFRHRYYVTAQELDSLTGTKNSYVELRKSSIALMKTQVIITHSPDGEALRNQLRANLVSSCEYLDREGRVGLRFTEEITPYLSELRTRFTKYQAKNVMPMRSAYGIRLYEICLSWLGEERCFSVEQFKEILDLKGRSFDRIEVIKRRVINPALKDINTHSDIRVKFDQKKTGRRVSHFIFSIVRPIKEKQAAAIALDFEPWVTRYNLAKDKNFPDWKSARRKLGKAYTAYRRDPLSWVQKNCPDSDYRQLLEAHGQERLLID